MTDMGKETRYINEADSVLSWSGRIDEMDRVHAEYVELVEAAFSDFVNRLAVSDPDRSADILELAAGIESSTFSSFLVAPEVTFRLLWPRRQEVQDTALFLALALRAEASRHGPQQCFSVPTWTVTGDVCFHQDGSRTVFEHGLEDLRIDFGSPYARHVDLEGTRAYLLAPRAPLSSLDQTIVLEKLSNALDGIKASKPECAWFIFRFTKMLTAQTDLVAPDRFSSGSTGQFVGRTALQITKATPAKLAEAILHEAIHSYLYMGEQRERWVLDPELYQAREPIMSPWTEAPLQLRPYLQACFVWFGLLQFWAEAYGADRFPPNEMRERIVQAASGFLGPSLVDRTGVADRLNADLCIAIRRMQSMVQKQFGEALTYINGTLVGEHRGWQV